MVGLKSKDYVEQGRDRYWLVGWDMSTARVNLVSETCSCGHADCDHIRRARLIRAQEEGRLQLSKRQITELVEILTNTELSLEAGLGRLFDCDPPRHWLDLIDNSSRDELFQRAGQCERCNKWVDIDDISEDVYGVCRFCVR